MYDWIKLIFKGTTQKIKKRRKKMLTLTSHWLEISKTPGLFVLVCFFFIFLMATPEAYGSSQVRD